MIKRIEFDEFGNITAIEFYDGVPSKQMMGDVEYVFMRMADIRKWYPNTAPQVENDVNKPEITKE